jgi:hypothetical protein
LLEQFILALFGIHPAQTPVIYQERAEIVVSRSRDYFSYAERKIDNPAEFKCFDELMQRESSWRTRKNPELADNPKSSAYGIPQALPGIKMASHGNDWATNPITQIRWAIDYISERYGSPCKALEFHNERGYY